MSILFIPYGETVLLDISIYYASSSMRTGGHLTMSGIVYSTLRTFKHDKA